MGLGYGILLSITASSTSGLGDWFVLAARAGYSDGAAGYSDDTEGARLVSASRAVIFFRHSSPCLHECTQCACSRHALLATGGWLCQHEGLTVQSPFVRSAVVALVQVATGNLRRACNAAPFHRSGCVQCVSMLAVKVACAGLLKRGSDGVRPHAAWPAWQCSADDRQHCRCCDNADAMQVNVTDELNCVPWYPIGAVSWECQWVWWWEWEWERTRVMAAAIGCSVTRAALAAAVSRCRAGRAWASSCQVLLAFFQPARTLPPLPQWQQTPLGS